MPTIAAEKAVPMIKNNTPSFCQGISVGRDSSGKLADNSRESQAIFWYHILTGIRHLIMDFFHIGESLSGSHYSSIFTVIFWIISSLILFGYLFI